MPRVREDADPIIFNRLPMKTLPLFATVALLSAVIAPSLSAVSPDLAELAETIDQRLDDPALAESHWGVLIESADTGAIWYERNADRLFVPASNQKILVAAAAYRSLGPDFCFETTLHRTGEIVDGVLQGDLVVVGRGDPSIYNRFYSDSTEAFRDWARQLKEQGIRRIAGNVIGDDDEWEDRHTGSGWPMDEITPWYYAEYGPLTFNENYIDIRFVPPSTVDGELVIEPNVESDYYTLVNNVEVVAEGSNRIWMSRPMFSNTITLGGRVAAGSRPFEETPTITNPTLFYATALLEVLEEEGITVDGAAVDCDDISGWKERREDFPVVVTHRSPPLSKIIPLFMKRSQNMTAENLVHTMGWHSTGFGSFSAGREVVREKLAEFGVDPERYRFADGSGLSRYNHITPRQIVAINRGMYESELRDLWLESQAVAGVDGTLRRISKDSPLTGNVRAKTGTLSTVRSLSGFITTAGGETVLFSILNNGSLRGAPAVDKVSHSVLELIAQFDRQPEAAKAGR